MPLWREIEINHTYCGDCLQLMKFIPENSIDSIVTDPPYGIKFKGNKWDYSIPSVEVWQRCLRLLKPGGYGLVACGTRTQHRMAVNIEDAGFEIRDIISWVYGSGMPKNFNIGKAVDKLQKNRKGIKKVSSYDGWGTALKPAMELWTLCRKPLEEKSVASNVLKYGTGGINVGECRVGENSIYRFPANLIHDGSTEVLEKFPLAPPVGTYTNSLSKPKVPNTGQIFPGAASTREQMNQFSGDTDSAARFFYCAKASRKERIGNNHPTVKPIKLIEYLCKLVTPKGGTILDPFAGSGTTGVVCKNLGLNFILIEKEQAYCEIIYKRLEGFYGRFNQ